MTYWEIWNEPECHCDRKVMWTGTWEQYLDLYGTTSKYLKAEFPEIKIGGYAGCGFYDIVKPGNERYKGFVDSFLSFLAYVKENNCPLDFYSWHSYDDPLNVSVYADFVDRKLKEFGFSGVEQHLNEWNCGPQFRGKACHAANTAMMILAMQNSPVDIGMFYDGRCGTSIYGGLFNPMTLQPLKAYWAFIAFNELYRRKNQVEAVSDKKEIPVVAAMDEDGGAVMISNYTGEAVPLELDLSGRKITACYLTDEVFDNTPVCFPGKLPPHSFMLLTVR